MTFGSEIIGLLLLIGMFVLLGLGIHIAWATAIPGLVGLWILGGGLMVALHMGGIAYHVMADYGMATLPLFMAMGLFAAEAGIGENALEAARVWVGRFRGGLAIATTFASAMFAAASGSTAASAALFSKLSFPEMVKHGYDKRVASGCVAASGTIAAMIPPSILLLLYGIIAEASLGKLLIAGIFPGILEAITYILVIYVIGLLKPNMLPQVGIGSKLTLIEKIKKTAGVLPIGFIFMAAIGGVFFGIFTPTEGGAFGAALCLIAVVVMRRLTRSAFLASLRETLHTTGMLMFILLGGFVFSRMLIVSGLMQAMANWLLGLPVPPGVIFLGITIFLVLAGMVMLPPVMMVIFVPIFLPPLIKMGYDPIWFGIMFNRLVELGLITPPIATNLYVVKGILGDQIEFGEVFQGIIPFIIADFLNLLVLYFFPQIALWLPNLMV